MPELVREQIISEVEFWRNFIKSAESDQYSQKSLTSEEQTSHH